MFGLQWLIVQGHVVSTANSSQDRTDTKRICPGVPCYCLVGQVKPSWKNFPHNSTHICMRRGRVCVHRNSMELPAMILRGNKFTYQSFLPSWAVKACFWKKREILLLYTKINVGEIYFLSFSKRVMLCLEKSYFMFCNNQISRCSVFLYSSFIITQSSTISLLGKGWHPPLCILRPLLSAGETVQFLNKY